MSYDKLPPRWEAPGVEPPETKKDSGWLPGEKPAADYFNWHQNRSFLAIKELQEKAAEKTEVAAAMARADEAFTSASNGKSAIAGAVTGMGVAASNSDTFAQLAGKITDISKDATSLPAHVLLNKTFYSEGKKQTGTMLDRGTVNSTPSANAATTLPAGYYASVVIAAVSFDAAKVLAGTTIAGKTGTMPNLTGIRNATGVAKWGDNALAVYPEQGYQKGGAGDGEIKVSTAQLSQALGAINGAAPVWEGNWGNGENRLSITPQRGYYDGSLAIKTSIPHRSAENGHMPATERTVWQDDRVFLKPPNGYYDGNTWVTTPAGNLNPSNIRAGAQILDVAGNFQGYLQREQRADASGWVIWEGLPFTPKSITGVGADYSNYTFFWSQASWNYVTADGITRSYDGRIQSGYGFIRILHGRGNERFWVSVAGT